MRDSFLNYLHGSEQTLQITNPTQKISKLPTRQWTLIRGWHLISGFSKLPTRQWTSIRSMNIFFCFSKLPTRQWTRARYTINVVGKKAKSIFTNKNPFLSHFSTYWFLNYFILSKKKGCNSLNVIAKNGIPQLFIARFLLWPLQNTIKLKVNDLIFYWLSL